MLDPRDHVRDKYAKRGIGGGLKPGRRPGVMVVDFIVGFTDPAYACGFDCPEAVVTTAGVLEAARSAGLPVLFSTTVFDPARQADSVWLEKMPAMKCLTPGSTPTMVDARLKPRPDEVLITKTAASCFTGTDLSTLLVQKAVDTLIVCGATTSGCIRASVVDACMGGWRTFVPRDCVADRDPLVHDANLFDIQAKYGEVVDAEYAAGLLREARP